MKTKLLSFLLLTFMVVSLACSGQTTQESNESQYNYGISRESNVFDYPIGRIQWTNTEDENFGEAELATGLFRVYGDMKAFSITFESKNFASDDFTFLVVEKEYLNEDGDLQLWGYAYGDDGYTYEYLLNSSTILGYINKFSFKRIDDGMTLSLFFVRN